MISEPMVHLAQTVILSCTETNSLQREKKSENPLDPRHLAVLSGASKMIFRAYGLFDVNRAPILCQD
jgi:hypothetical protein